MNKKLLLSAVSLLAISYSESYAAGFQLTETSTVAVGRAFAGGGIVGDDLSAIAFNPAGMSLFDGTMAGQTGITAVNLVGNFDGTVTTVGASQTTYQDVKTLSYLPHAYAVGKVNEKINIGLGITAPFGLETQYDRDWAGARFGVRSYMATIDINPSISYKINDKWSVGAGVSAQYMEATLTSNNLGALGYFKVKGDSWGFGYNAGLMYEPLKNTRVGLSYRSMVTHTIEGTTYTTLLKEQGDTSAKIALPESVLLSGFHKLNDKFGLSASARWTNWSRFDELAIKSPAVGNTVTPENWRDTYSISAGFDYYAAENFTLRAGLGFDRGAISNPNYRTPRIPDADRMQLGLGLSYKYNENVTFDLAYMHLFLDNADMVHKDAYGSVAGEFDPHTDLFSAAIQVKF